MYQETLQTAGLSPNEAKIYEALLDLGESSVPQVSIKTGINRRNAYDTIERLVSKGLCFPIFSSKDNKYSPVDPGKLLEILGERQQKIQAILPELEAKFKTQQPPEEAYIYRGLEGQKNVWRDCLRAGETVYTVGANGSWYDPRLETATKSFFREANRKKIKFVEIFNHEASQQIPNFPKHFLGQLEYRVLPQEYSTDSIIVIFGDYVVTYTGCRVLRMDDNAVFFVLRSRALADSYRVWFQALWHIATA